MTEPAGPGRGLLLDTNVLRRVDTAKSLAASARRAGWVVATGTQTYAELLRQFRAKVPRAFSADMVRDALAAAGIEVLPFTREDAEALEVWTHVRFGGDRGYQAWKARNALVCVRGLLQTVCDDLGEERWSALLAAANDSGKSGKRAASTVDWLTIGQALRWGCRLVSLDKGGEFEGLDFVLSLEEAQRNLEVHHAG